MVKYKLIIEYYQKGNNNSQIATLCGCSRTVVWEVLNRFNKIETIFADIQRMSEEELRILLFPERVKKDKGYLIPDFKWEEFQMRKHQSSLRLCWRRYCKRAAKQNLKAYSWASFGLFYTLLAATLNDNLAEIVGKLQSLMDSFWIYIVMALAAVVVVWGAFVGIKIAIAHKNEEKINARDMVKNLIIGIIIIFVVAMGAPLLINGLSAWVGA